MILQRYITIRILRPLAGVLTFFIALYLAWAATDLITAGGAKSMRPDEFLRMLGLQLLTVMELLLPVSLFLAITSGLGQMAANQETLAIRANGKGDGMVLRSVLLIGVVAAGLVAWLMFELRPPVFEQIYQIKRSISDDSDFRRIQGGEFYLIEEDGGSAGNNNARVIFADRSAGDVLHDVFVARNYDGTNEFIYASKARQEYSPEGQRRLYFSNGYLYQLQDNQGLGGDWHMRFKDFTLIMPIDENEWVSGRRKAKTLPELAVSDDPYDVTEYQRRFGAPLSALLLALLAIPLSRVAPRRSRYGRTILAAVMMILYFNIDSLSRTWVEQAVVPPFPGIFWPHMLMLALLLAFYWPLKRPARARPAAARI